MGLPPNARRYFAEKRLDAAYKLLGDVQEMRSKEGQEDRREFQKFYNNLALFSSGTIALSVTYLGYLKTLSRPLQSLTLLKASWTALFVCLIFSLVYVLINLYYAFHCREEEFAKAQKNKYETELNDFPEMQLANLQTAQEKAEFENPRKKAIAILDEKIEHHHTRGDRYLKSWKWAGRIARLGFAAGIALLLWFAIKNT